MGCGSGESIATNCCHCSLLGMGVQLTFDQYAASCGPPVSLVGIAPSLHVTRMVRDEAVDGLDDVGWF